MDSDEWPFIVHPYNLEFCITSRCTNVLGLRCFSLKLGNLVSFILVFIHHMRTYSLIILSYPLHTDRKLSHIDGIFMKIL